MDELIRRVDAVEERVRKGQGRLRRTLRKQGEEVRAGFAEVRAGLDQVRSAVGRQEMRFTAWIEGVEANLDEHQRETSESLTEFAAILRSHLGRSGQEFEVLRETSKDHEERLRRLEGAA